jgi:ATP-dependent Clp protease ATP-binding subunit ClpB
MIVAKMLMQLEQQLEKQRILVSFTEAVEKDILLQAFSKEYGARPLRRYIQKELETFIAKQLIQGKILPNLAITIDINQQGYLIKTSD